MNKSFKRIVACMLMLCLMLCAAIPAVIAADTTDPVVYNFSQSKYGSNKITGWISNIAARYADPADSLNWKYEACYDEAKTDKISFYPTTGGMRLAYNEGDWAAFRFRSPGAGIYEVCLKHGVGALGAKEANLYILPGSTTDIVGELATATPVLTFNSYAAENAPGGESGKGQYKFAEDQEYIVVFLSVTKNDTVAANKTTAYTFPASLNLTTVESYEAKIGAQYYTTVEAAMEAAGNDSTVKLVADATATEISLLAGVTLDLNGKTLTADDGKFFGVVTDSSVGSTGMIVGQSAVQNVGENEIALYDGTATRIVEYTLVADDEAAVDDAGTTATFWYTFKFDNAEAYRMIAAADNNAGFNVGATLTFNGNPVPVSLKDGTVSGWAGEMAKNPDAGYAFYVAVSGFENLDASVTGELGVKLTVTGAAGAAESAVVNYTIG